MGFYSEKILPTLLSKAMAQPIFQPYRRETLKDLSGEVLEIGFGTGEDLAYYPANVKKLTTIDASSGMNALAQKRIKTSPLTYVA